MIGIMWALRDAVTLMASLVLGSALMDVSERRVRSLVTTFLFSILETLFAKVDSNKRDLSRFLYQEGDDPLNTL